MTRPGTGDDHRARVDARSYETLAVALEVLHGRFPYVLGGGWAVCGHGSVVPSVDTDLFVSRGEAGPVREALETRGLEVGEGRRCELLSLDEPNNILGQDTELGDPELGYIPAQLLEGNVRELTIRAGALEARASVPDAAPLLFMKLKAYHDRELAWRALRHPEVMARIPPAEQPLVRMMVEGHWIRKAGKDLFDIAFLAARHVAIEDALALGDARLRPVLAGPLRRVPLPLLEFARDLASGDSAAMRWLATRPHAPG